MELNEQVSQYIERNLTVYDEDYRLKPDDLIFELGYVDSVFAVQLVCFLEEQIGVPIQDTDLDIDNFSSVNRIVEFIQRKQQAG